MEYRSPAPITAFFMAMVSGTLLATGSYVGGAVLACLAMIVFGLWRLAEDRGDDDRYTLW